MQSAAAHHELISITCWEAVVALLLSQLATTRQPASSKASLACSTSQEHLMALYRSTRGSCGLTATDLLQALWEDPRVGAQIKSRL